MHSKDHIRMKHMLDAALQAQEFAQGRTRDSLDEDRMLTLAIVKSIEIIGEAASRVGDETRGACPAVPWTDIVGMRNRLIHVYFDIDLDLVWETVITDLQPLIDELEKILVGSDLVGLPPD